MELNRFIEHTLLRADAGEAEIRKLCHEAVVHSFHGVCVNSCYVAVAKEALKSEGGAGAGPVVVSVVGFPLGAMDTRSKAFETEQAINNGAQEIDMVINLGALKDRRLSAVREDIAAVVKAAGKAPVKVIIETGLLSDAEKKSACLTAVEAGARFVKTCTGFAKGQAEIQDIELMRALVGQDVGVKASGGIKTRDFALDLLKAGADRLGTSCGVQLMSGLDVEHSY